MKSLIESTQQLGRALMLPIAVLPVPTSRIFRLSPVSRSRRLVRILASSSTIRMRSRGQGGS